jgi:hypothetical protein
MVSSAISMNGVIILTGTYLNPAQPQIDQSMALYGLPRQLIVERAQGAGKG